MKKAGSGIPPSIPRLIGIHFFQSATRRIPTVRIDSPAEVIVMLSGTYSATETIHEHDVTFSAHAGDVVYWPANTRRLEENDPRHPVQCLAIYLRWNGVPPPLPRRVRDTQAMIRLLAIHLLAVNQESQRLPQEIWNGFLIAIIAEMVRLGRAQEDPLVRAIADYIETHIGESLTVAVLAQVAGLNRHHFSRIFKKRSGHSPMDFVRRHRVKRTLGMLASQPNWTIHRIASRIGIQGDAQLRRLLKRYTGLGARHILKIARARMYDPFSAQALIDDARTLIPLEL